MLYRKLISLPSRGMKHRSVIAASLFICMALSISAQQCIPSNHQTDTSFGGNLTFGCSDDACGQDTLLDGSSLYSIPPWKPATVAITRVVSDQVNTNGSLRNAHSLFSNGVVSSKACMTVNISWTGTAPDVELTLNNAKIWASQLPMASNNVGSYTGTVEIDTALLRFAMRNVGGIPMPGVNELYMNTIGAIGNAAPFAE
jgi:hypothetical protein